jgi:hypothetical protein
VILKPILSEEHAELLLLTGKMPMSLETGIDQRQPLLRRPVPIHGEAPGISGTGRPCSGAKAEVPSTLN